MRDFKGKSEPTAIPAPRNAKRGLDIRYSTKIRGSLECGQEDRYADHYAIGLRPGPSPPPGEW